MSNNRNEIGSCASLYDLTIKRIVEDGMRLSNVTKGAYKAYADYIKKCNKTGGTYDEFMRLYPSLLH